MRVLKSSNLSCNNQRRRIYEYTEINAKVVAVGWGDVLECRSNHLAARLIWRKVFGRTSLFVGWWFGVVWTRWSTFFEGSIPPSSLYSIFSLLQIILVQNFYCSAARNSISRAAASTFAFSSTVYIMYPSSIAQVSICSLKNILFLSTVNCTIFELRNQKPSLLPCGPIECTTCSTA